MRKQNWGSTGKNEMHTAASVANPAQITQYALWVFAYYIQAGIEIGRLLSAAAPVRQDHLETLASLFNGVLAKVQEVVVARPAIQVAANLNSQFGIRHRLQIAYDNLTFMQIAPVGIRLLPLKYLADGEESASTAKAEGIFPLAESRALRMH